MRGLAYLETMPSWMYRSFLVLLPMMLFLMNRRDFIRSWGTGWPALPVLSWETATSWGVNVIGCIGGAVKGWWDERQGRKRKRRPEREKKGGGRGKGEREEESECRLRWM